MTDLAHYESTLEKLITEHLVKNDWCLGESSNYNREYGLDLNELMLFILKK